MIVCNTCDYDDTSGSAPLGEPGSDTPDHTDRRRCREMLVGDGHLARRPPLTDVVQHRRQEIEVDLFGAGARTHGAFDELHGAVLVAGEQAGLELRWEDPGSRTILFLGIVEAIELGNFDDPLPAILLGHQPTGANISIRSHVVNAESGGSLGERDALSHEASSRSVLRPISAMARRLGLRGG